MTPRESVASLFEHREVSPMPYWLPMEGDVERRLDEHYGSSEWRRRIVPYFIAGHHVGAKGSVKLSENCYRDPYGTVFETGSALHVLEPALNRPSLDGYSWPEAEGLCDWDELAQYYESLPETFRLCGVSWGFFERSWLLRGFENILVDMVENEQFVHDLLDSYLRLKLQALDLMLDRIPCEGIFDGGDDCGQRGPFMGLARWRTFVKPRLSAVIEYAHGKGLPVVTHMCGNVRPLIDDLLEIKLDGLESLQPEAMDIFELRRQTRGRLVMIGGLGVQSILPFGSPDELRSQIQRLRSEIGSQGGYILAPAKPLMSDVSTANALAVLEEFTQGDR